MVGLEEALFNSLRRNSRTIAKSLRTPIVIPATYRHSREGGNPGRTWSGKRPFPSELHHLAIVLPQLRGILIVVVGRTKEGATGWRRWILDSSQRSELLMALLRPRMKNENKVTLEPSA